MPDWGVGARKGVRRELGDWFGGAEAGQEGSGRLGPVDRAMLLNGNQGLECKQLGTGIRTWAAPPTAMTLAKSRPASLRRCMTRSTASRKSLTGVVISPSPAGLTTEPLEVLWCARSLSKLTVAATTTWSEPTEMAEALRAWVDKSKPRKRGAMAVRRAVRLFLFISCGGEGHLPNGRRWSPAVGQIWSWTEARPRACSETRMIISFHFSALKFVDIARGFAPDHDDGRLWYVDDSRLECANGSQMHLRRPRGFSLRPKTKRVRTRFASGLWLIVENALASQLARHYRQLTMVLTVCRFPPPRRPRPPPPRRPPRLWPQRRRPIHAPPRRL